MSQDIRPKEDCQQALDLFAKLCYMEAIKNIHEPELSLSLQNLDHRCRNLEKKQNCQPDPKEEPTMVVLTQRVMFILGRYTTSAFTPLLLEKGSDENGQSASFLSRTFQGLTAPNPPKIQAWEENDQLQAIQFLSAATALTRHLPPRDIDSSLGSALAWAKGLESKPLIIPSYQSYHPYHPNQLRQIALPKPPQPRSQPTGDDEASEVEDDEASEVEDDQATEVGDDQATEVGEDDEPMKVIEKSNSINRCQRGFWRRVCGMIKSGLRTSGKRTNVSQESC